METLGAGTLPVRSTAKKQNSPEIVRVSGPAPMSGHSIPALLVLRSSALSPHAVRVAARQARLNLTIESVHNRREFLDELRRGSTDLIIAGPEGLPDIGAREVLDRARSADPPVPVLIAGGNVAESEAAGILREGAAELLQSGEMERLPSAIDRALKVRQAAVLQTQTLRDLDRTAVVLRENQKLITVGRLAASIAHEINNPLESVMNLLYLLGLEKNLSPAVANYLSLAQRELERVSQISRQTLRFSRETAGPVPVRLPDLLEEVLFLYDRTIREKSIVVERQYDCKEEPTLYPGEMRQVLSNLVANALEASSPHGRLRLRVRCAHSWTDPGVRGVRISIGDNGGGIPLEVQRRLGEPFFTTKGQRGTGLGLWVTRSIVQRYGGEMQLRSSVDSRRHGTVFSIFLPTNLRPHAVDRPPRSGPAGGSSAVAFPSPAASGNESSSGAASLSSVQPSSRRTLRGA